LLSAEIIKQGYGFPYTRFPFARMEEFRHVERGPHIKFLPLLTQKLSGQALSNSGKNRRMKTLVFLVTFVLASVHFADAQQQEKL